MAWYHIYQFAEITHPLYTSLKDKALPILKYEICEDKILAVEVCLHDNLHIWFKKKHVNLFRSAKCLATLPEHTGSKKGFLNLLKKFNLRRR